MTTAADDRAVEEAFEASLAGRPVRAEAAGLAAFTSAVRGTATQPGRPNAALAELLSTGLLTDQSSPSTRTAPAAGPLPSRSARSRTRRRFTVIVPALIAKFLSAGAIAQACTGAGVVVVVAAGAGTAGVLPDGAQETFSDLTGISQPADEAGDELAPPVAQPVEGTPVDPADPALAAPVEEETNADADAEAFDAEVWGQGYNPDDYASFGAWVSLGAHNKADLAEFLAEHEYRNFGAMVSAEAHKKGMDDNELEDELADEGLELEDLQDEDVTDGEVTETPDGSEVGTSDAGDDSTSHGKSAGKGNAGAKTNGHGGGKGHGKN
jgi:hypothetical protein